ncbi:hypothetical protein [Cerasicoccus arenae]|uniref:Uncharacterized protein n=1 Tax=Cerasicoccus arenae TaxID=424488 RepID=A0A8J3DLD5_9BACT|nr:hypothetical protein [Cerasicoccus arenae]MBK1858748.1 hypothetical protein [Cerasicoccus arenae]GHC07270.1 hypothetical protein GCM10007047_25440 [Cerasicoccus arenae]
MTVGTYIESRDPRVIDREIELIKEAAKELMEDREKFLRLAQATGMYKKDGSLKKQFR